GGGTWRCPGVSPEPGPSRSRCLCPEGARCSPDLVGGGPNWSLRPRVDSEVRVSAGAGAFFLRPCAHEPGTTVRSNARGRSVSRGARGGHRKHGTCAALPYCDVAKNASGLSAIVTVAAHTRRRETQTRNTGRDRIRSGGRFPCPDPNSWRALCRPRPEPVGVTGPTVHR